jgi:hypothetical protein
MTHETQALVTVCQHSPGTINSIQTDDFVIYHQRLEHKTLFVDRIRRETVKQLSVK